MKQLEHLSYSSLTLWEEDREAFYLRYLAENRVPAPPQTEPMAAGSAFDAYVKSYLSARVLGDSNLDELFEESVEPHVRDWARPVGLHLLQAYARSGALKGLLRRLEKAKDVRFESTVVEEIDGVRIKGKPDLEFREVEKIIFDWKVSGYCSWRTTSPRPGYLICRDGWRKHTHKTHKQPREIAHANPVWGEQLSTYGLMRGASQGIIHQIVGPKEKLRVAEYESPLTCQQRMLDRFKACWDAIQSGQIFENPGQADRLERAAAQMLIGVSTCSV